MDNKKITDPNLESDWFDDLLHQPKLDAEIGPDENAVSAAGLSDISDLEFEKIMQEALAEQLNTPDPAAEETPETTPAAEIQDEYADEGTPPPAAEETEEPEEEAPADPNTPVRKVRPRRKKGYGLFGLPHLLSTAIWIALILFIGSTLGRLLWLCASDMLAFGREENTVYISITDSDDMDSITEKLHSAGLIRYKSVFKFFADLVSAEEKISVGTFKLNTLYDYNALINGMKEKSSYRESVEVVIPEGYSCAQVFSLLEEKGVCSAEKLEAYAMESEFANYWFLEGVERGNKYTLEGFLFPDTYEFYTNSSAKLVYIKFLDRFDEKLHDIKTETGTDFQTFLEELNLRIATVLRQRGYDQSYIDDHMMDLYDVITVASMIEKESAHTGENYDVSSVIFNRLTNQREFPYLQIDATIVYATGNSDQIDTSFDTPYNTYLYGGLPPTPISNPGLSAILAALSPAETGYYYYALNPATGEHHFSRTLKEHQEFLNSLR